jgi:hypothetical protein
MTHPVVTFASHPHGTPPEGAEVFEVSVPVHYWLRPDPKGGVWWGLGSLVGGCAISRMEAVNKAIEAARALAPKFERGEMPT